VTAVVSGALVAVGFLAAVLAAWTFDAAQREALARLLTAIGLPPRLPLALAVAAVASLVIGVPAGLCFGVVGAIWYGGADAVQHAVLRWLLRRRGALPRRFPHFLEHCVRLVFLQRAGGGYRFVHGALLAHFAAGAVAQGAARAP
jgi:hypothetical protein